MEECICPSNPKSYQGLNHGPQPFRHQGPVSWKTTLLQTPVGRDGDKVYITLITHFVSIIIVSAPPRIIRHWSLEVGLEHRFPESFLLLFSGPPLPPGSIQQRQLLFWFFHHTLPTVNPLVMPPVWDLGSSVGFAFYQWKGCSQFGAAVKEVAVNTGASALGVDSPALRC